MPFGDIVCDKLLSNREIYRQAVASTSSLESVHTGGNEHF